VAREFVALQMYLQHQSPSYFSHAPKLRHQKRPLFTSPHSRVLQTRTYRRNRPRRAQQTISLPSNQNICNGLSLRRGDPSRRSFINDRYTARLHTKGSPEENITRQIVGKGRDGAGTSRVRCPQDPRTLRTRRLFGKVRHRQRQ
jgi:hypothetical protein